MENTLINPKIVLLYAAPSFAMIDQCLPIINEMSKNSDLIKIIAFREAEVLNQLKKRETLNLIVAESFDLFLIPGKFKWKSIKINKLMQNNEDSKTNLKNNHVKKNKFKLFKIKIKFLHKITTLSKYRKIYKRIFSHPIKLNRFLKTQYRHDQIIVLTDIEIMHKKEAQKHLKKFYQAKWISIPHGIVLENKNAIKNHKFYNQFNYIYFFSKLNLNSSADNATECKIKLIPIPRHSESWLLKLKKYDSISDSSNLNMAKTILLASSTTNSLRAGEKQQYLMDIINVCKNESLDLFVLTHPKENDLELFENLAKSLEYNGSVNYVTKSIFNLNFNPLCSISFGSTVDFDLLRIGVPLLIHHDFRFGKEINPALSATYSKEDIFANADKIIHVADKIALDRLSANIAEWSFNYDSLLRNISKSSSEFSNSEQIKNYEKLFLKPTKDNFDFINDLIFLREKNA